MDKKRTKIITIASIKGGVGKSTSAILFSTIISKKSSVLLIDMDAQASLTSYFNEYLEKARINVENTNVYEILRKNLDINNSICNINQNLDFIPSYLNLHFFNNDNLPFKETRLKKALYFIKNTYDYIIIDTNPSLDFTLINALVVSNFVISPIPAEKWSIESLEALNFKVKQLDLNLPIYILNTRLKNNNSNKFYLDILKQNSNFIGSIREREDLNKRIAQNIGFSLNEDYTADYKKALKNLFGAEQISGRSYEEE
ncbi:ParA family protein [Borrelia venezuelensis]|uniref:ParA family protein n=1 Tax=Borrelia venezuelensis TaxID=1653839 RepID=UPI001FF33DD4|nr:ParA family protein [Borrelia venezuelensis]UPA12747.1 ParA family protein [Borrelia venezuelensis]